MAESQNKLLFIDGFATWCVPCKKMEAEVFNDPRVSDFYNKHFINLRIDMENGEGAEIAKKYAVNGYPTQLFINSKGEEVHRGIGYQSPTQIVELAKIALNPQQCSGGLAKKYRDGYRNPDFLLQYIHQLRSTQVSYEQVANDYLLTQPNWLTSANMQFIINNVHQYNSSGFQFLVNQRDHFDREFGYKIVNEKILKGIYELIYMGNASFTVEEIKTVFYNSFPYDEAQYHFNAFMMKFYEQAKDYSNYFKTASKHFNNPKTTADWSELNTIAWDAYSKTNDPVILHQAILWVKKSIQQDSNYFNNDTLAALYFKLGKNQKAIRHAKRALAYAQKYDQDASSTLILLEQINYATN
jgi:thiol-disulfide isomerase/thioredoxin